MKIKSPVIVAFDTQSIDEVRRLVDILDPSLCRAKVGKELFTACGVAAVEVLHNAGFDVFLDLKFHDIPNTVAKAVDAAVNMGVWMVNVHASGGERMLAAAREAIERKNASTLLIAVTVLTSMDDSELQELGVSRTIKQQVLALAKLAQAQKLDGVVCSANEALFLREKLGSDFRLVTPGIRPKESSADDQRRICTPAEAVANGSDFLVIGRPITQAANPMEALCAINESIACNQDIS